MKPESPKDFDFIVIKAIAACKYNAKWHSRLPSIHWSNVVRNTHYVCFAAIYKGQVFATTIWSSPVAQNRFSNGKQVLELRRMAISKDCPKNTATRMLSHNRTWIKTNFQDISLLVSYQDTDVHLGTIYKADNWTNANYTKGMKWDTDNRKRNIEQSLADKIRWEYRIKDALDPEQAAKIRASYKPSDFISKSIADNPFWIDIIRGDEHNADNRLD